MLQVGAPPNLNLSSSECFDSPNCKSPSCDLPSLGMGSSQALGCG